MNPKRFKAALRALFIILISCVEAVAIVELVRGTIFK